MNKREQEAFFDKFSQNMRETLLKKGDDYAGHDRLANFKKAGAICGVTAEMNCLNLIATKVARLGVLLNSGVAPKNEAVEDSCLDGSNYFALLAMLIEDRKNNQTIN